ncbi:MAG: hypothetical protein H0W99_14380 [Acidobacteria bacterium]|nr:hypothetical protein [Acidobacteriota bacterium]
MSKRFIRGVLWSFAEISRAGAAKRSVGGRDRVGEVMGQVGACAPPVYKDISRHVPRRTCAGSIAESENMHVLCGAGGTSQERDVW